MNREMKYSCIDWIGYIPKTWNVGKVKQAFFRHKDKARQENPVILSLARSGIKIRNVSDNKGQLAESYYNYNPVKKGDLLLNPMDLYSGANCNVSKIDGVISPAYINLRSKNGYSPQYYDYYFKTQYWGMVLFAHGKGVSFDNRWTLNNETLMSYFIPVPSLQEQQDIADYLDKKVYEIDNIITQTNLSINEYKKYKQALITETVTKGLIPDVKMKDSGIEWIGNIPENWGLKSLRYLGSLQNGISKGADYFGFGYPFVSYGDVYRNMELPLNGSGLANSNDSDRENYSIKKGDVLFTRTSETIEEVGFASTCLNTIENAVFSGFIIRFRPFTNEISENYSKYYFRSHMHRRFFVKEMNLVTRASLSQELLKKLPVIIPSKGEQQQITDYLDKKCSKIDNLITEKEQLLTELQAYKKSLIYECVTGKRKVD